MRDRRARRAFRCSGVSNSLTRLARFWRKSVAHRGSIAPAADAADGEDDENPGTTRCGAMLGPAPAGDLGGGLMRRRLCYVIYLLTWVRR